MPLFHFPQCLAVAAAPTLLPFCLDLVVTSKASIYILGNTGEERNETNSSAGASNLLAVVESTSVWCLRVQCVAEMSFSVSDCSDGLCNGDDVCLGGIA